MSGRYDNKQSVSAFGQKFSPGALSKQTCTLLLLMMMMMMMLLLLLLLFMLLLLFTHVLCVTIDLFGEKIAKSSHPYKIAKTPGGTPRPNLGEGEGMCHFRMSLILTTFT